MLSVSTDALLAIAQIITAFAVLVGAIAGLVWMCRRDPKREDAAFISVANALRAIFSKPNRREQVLRTVSQARKERALVVETNQVE